MIHRRIGGVHPLGVGAQSAVPGLAKRAFSRPKTRPRGSKFWVFREHGKWLIGALVRPQATLPEQFGNLLHCNDAVAGVADQRSLQDPGEGFRYLGGIAIGFDIADLVQ